ncbi:hypothetical protein PACTADRAFT_34578 [Pachysolen tannophilus NRRL Y-2460]|uniref:Uncharacterized protein n=1 Tax=Pachysolen tannophilus NRRL Y-2460 TaxID=669874 RepID=A0A1E4TSX3_PACTA|nr:hypothetical protein PACTADRAFT_34578 [Pachysolen tannophilus NRRL Y-2460]
MSDLQEKSLHPNDEEFESSHAQSTNLSMSEQQQEQEQERQDDKLPTDETSRRAKEEAQAEINLVVAEGSMHAQHEPLVSHKSISTDVTYEITEEPHYIPTRALLIGNLTSPFDNKMLQDMLERSVKKGNAFIERAWLNPKRTHSIVLVSEIEGAKAIRNDLNGRIFPLVDDELERKEEVDENGNVIKRKRLFIDYISYKIVQFCIDQEENGPTNAIWKFDYEKHAGKIIAKHKMVNYSDIEHKTNNFFIDRRRGPTRGSFRGNGKFYSKTVRGNWPGSYNYTHRFNRNDRFGNDRSLSSSYVPGKDKSGGKSKAQSQFHDSRNSEFESPKNPQANFSSHTESHFVSTTEKLIKDSYVNESAGNKSRYIERSVYIPKTNRGSFRGGNRGRGGYRGDFSLRDRYSKPKAARRFSTDKRINTKERSAFNSENSYKSERSKSPESLPTIEWDLEDNRDKTT